MKGNTSASGGRMRGKQQHGTCWNDDYCNAGHFSARRLG
jgi:hypothetical protein